MSYKTELRDGMMIDFDVPITMNDGVILRADVYRPSEKGSYPVLLTYGPYGKGLAFQDLYKTCWDRMVEEHPDVAAGSTNKYQNWEVADPEKWVPHGYVVVRVDSRGNGRSPGYVNLYSPRETRDLYDCIEWAGVQPWSNGKVGLNGISYYAMNQWQVASLQPRHLTAMCIWEGAADFYRDWSHHGGILNTFLASWYDMQVIPVQHGIGKRGYRSRVTGDLVSGPETLTEEELGSNRSDFGEECFIHSLNDEFWKSRTPDWSKVKTPFLSAANWGGNGLHPRGNFEGFIQAASEQKWLEAHGIEHWTHFYTDYGRLLQKRFFDYFLKGVDNGWQNKPRVQLQIRHIDRFIERYENEWPLARTKWTKFYLEPIDLTLKCTPVKTSGSVMYDGFGDGVTFLLPPLEEEMEITGPSMAKLFISSSTKDADIFLVLRVFSPDLKEVVFQGALDPHTPIAQGWLRASHRKLDPALSTEYRPYHTHETVEPLTPGQVYELDVEIWPTCIVVPVGYRIALTVRGRDYVYAGGGGGKLSNMKYEFTGCGPFLHNESRDRPSSVFGGKISLHAGGDKSSYILLPIIPK